MPFVDPDTGMAAQQITESNGQRLAASHGLFPFCLVAEVEVITAGTGITQRAESLPVQIDQIITVQIPGIDGHGIHAILLIGGEDSADGAVTQGIVLQKIQAHGYADTVVSTQTGTLSGQRYTVVDDLNGVIQRIITDALLADADHIHMRLKDDAGYIFTAGRGGLINNDLI